MYNRLLKTKSLRQQVVLGSKFKPFVFQLSSFETNPLVFKRYSTHKASFLFPNYLPRWHTTARQREAKSTQNKTDEISERQRSNRLAVVQWRQLTWQTEGS
jgi:hypothetical protein